MIFHSFLPDEEDEDEDDAAEVVGLAEGVAAGGAGEPVRAAAPAPAAQNDLSAAPPAESMALFHDAAYKTAIAQREATLAAITPVSAAALAQPFVMPSPSPASSLSSACEAFSFAAPYSYGYDAADYAAASFGQPLPFPVSARDDQAEHYVKDFSFSGIEALVQQDEQAVKQDELEFMSLYFLW